MRKLSNLPSEILVDILTRLPTESTLDCKLVHTSWRNLVSNSSFSRLHLSHLTDPPGKLIFLTLAPPYHHRYIGNQQIQHPYEHQQFHYFEYNENHDDQTPIYSNRLMNLIPPYKSYRIIGSCNGLICLNPNYYDFSSDSEPAYICNPITKEYVILSESTRLKRKMYRVYTGFGYLCETNEYKVVRIDYSKGGSNFECVEVYTLGGCNGWRNIGEHGLSFSACSFANENGVFANEALYWITKNGKIVAFDLVDERFYELPALRCLSLADNWDFESLADNRDFEADIGVLGGSLCCCITRFSAKRVESCAESTDFWLLKKNGNHSMMEEEEFFSLAWPWGLKSIDKKPLALTKTGEVLFSSCTHLYSYDIKSHHLKMLVKLPQPIYQAIPHMNTLVSLRALGEVDTKTMD